MEPGHSVHVAVIECNALLSLGIFILLRLSYYQAPKTQWLLDKRLKQNGY
jgi:hypothetical protein